MSEQKKQEQQIENKSNKSQIIFAKEIVINFRFLLVTLGITLIFFIIYNFIFNPAKLGTNNVTVTNTPEITLGKNYNLKNDYYTAYNNALNVDNQPQPDPVEEFSNRANNMPIFLDKQSLGENVIKAINHDAAQAVGLTPGYSFEGFGDSKYDWGCQTLDDLDNHRKWAFREDITSKSLYCFFLSLSVLVLGRYIYKGINWVNNTYQKSNPNSIPKSDNSPQMNENNKS